jgi:hypothetical protein
MRRFAGNRPHSLPSVIWRHGAAHRGLEIEFVRVTDGARDRSGGGVDQERPSALERGTVTVDPVDLLVFGVTCHRARSHRQQPGFRGLLAHKDDRQSLGGR